MKIVAILLLLALIFGWSLGTVDTNTLKVAVVTAILVRSEAILALKCYTWWHSIVDKYWRQPELLYSGRRLEIIDPVRIRGPSQKAIVVVCLADYAAKLINFHQKVKR